MFLILSFLALNRGEGSNTAVGGPSAHTSTSFGLLLSFHTMIATKAPQHLLSTEALPRVKFSMLSHLGRQNTKHPFYLQLPEAWKKKRLSNICHANNYSKYVRKVYTMLFSTGFQLKSLCRPENVYRDQKKLNDRSGKRPAFRRHLVQLEQKNNTHRDSF